MKRLSPLSALRLMTEGMRSDDRVALATAFLDGIDNPGAHAALREHAHQMARHADRLERQMKRVASRDGHCRPEVPASSGDLPRGGGDAAPRGLFSLIPGGAP